MEIWLCVAVGAALSGTVCANDGVGVNKLGLLAFMLLTTLYSPLVYLWLETIKIIVPWHFFVSVFTGFLVAVLGIVAVSLEHPKVLACEKINYSGLVLIALPVSIIVLDYLQNHAA